MVRREEVSFNGERMIIEIRCEIEMVDFRWNWDLMTMAEVINDAEVEFM
jgi:hypothetical protein